MPAGWLLPAAQLLVAAVDLTAVSLLPAVDSPAAMAPGRSGSGSGRRRCAARAASGRALVVRLRRETAACWRGRWRKRTKTPAPATRRPAWRKPEEIGKWGWGWPMKCVEEYGLLMTGLAMRSLASKAWTPSTPPRIGCKMSHIPTSLSRNFLKIRQNKITPAIVRFNASKVAIALSLLNTA